MRIKNVVHREEAYLGAVVVTVKTKIKGRTYLEKYESLSPLLEQWEVVRNDDYYILDRQDAIIATVDIWVYYNDGRKQQKDNYKSLKKFLEVWQDKEEFFKWEGRRYK